MNRRIVVVEDDPDTLEILLCILKREDFDAIGFRQVSSVNEILHLAPELVLLDIWLDALSGAEIACAMKGNRQSRDIPVAFISAVTNGEQIAAACGVDAFIAKPFEYDTLIRKISALMQAEPAHPVNRL